MYRWILKKLGIYKKRNKAELEIIEKIGTMSISEKDKDMITDIVKTALDKQFSL